MALRNAFEEVATEATVAERFGSAKLTTAEQVSGAGDNTVYTPASGKAIKLSWIGLSTSEDNSGEVLAIVLLGTDVVYRWNMGAPGAFMHWQTVIGEVDASLIVNLDQAQAVEVNYTLEEV